MYVNSVYGAWERSNQQITSHSVKNCSSENKPLSNTKYNTVVKVGNDKVTMNELDTRKKSDLYLIAMVDGVIFFIISTHLTMF